MRALYLICRARPKVQNQKLGTYLLGFVPSQSQPEVQLGPAVRGSRDYARRRRWEGRPRPITARRPCSTSVKPAKPLRSVWPNCGLTNLGKYFAPANKFKFIALSSPADLLKTREWTYLGRARFAICCPRERRFLLTEQPHELTSKFIFQKIKTKSEYL